LAEYNSHSVDGEWEILNKLKDGDDNKGIVFLTKQRAQHGNSQPVEVYVLKFYRTDIEEDFLMERYFIKYSTPQLVTAVRAVSARIGMPPFYQNGEVFT
jgi:hypothetical protein